MPVDYPYMISNNKIEPILEKIQQAEKPSKFTHGFLKKLGFTSSNDRAIIPLLKRLGYLSDNGIPTEYYADLKDKTKQRHSLAQRIIELYSELYSINTDIHDAPDDEIKGAISRVTGKESKVVSRYFATFKAISGIADFKLPPIKKKEEKLKEQEKAKPKEIEKETIIRAPTYHYNIQIHLPATTDIGVYNAIFKSLKENLLI